MKTPRTWTLSLWTLLAAVALSTSPNAVRADDPPQPMQGGVTVQVVDPATLGDAGKGVETVKVGAAAGLHITADAARTVRIAVIEKPAIQGDRYFVKAWIRYENVEGDGYLEMWNHVGDGQYFSRTLGDSGPMAKITGTSGWRVALLPFNLEPGTKPTRLEVNLVLAGKGTVTVGDLRLVDPPKNAKDGAVGWWTPQQGGWIGGIGGTLCGIIGAIAGIMAKRSMPGVIVLARGMAIVGVIILVAGIAAVTLGQPWHVWYPPVLLGSIAALVFGVNLPRLKRGMIEGELQRMRVADA